MFTEVVVAYHLVGIFYFSNINQTDLSFTTNKSLLSSLKYLESACL